MEKWGKLVVVFLKLSRHYCRYSTWNFLFKVNCVLAPFTIITIELQWAPRELEHLIWMDGKMKIKGIVYFETQN